MATMKRPVHFTWSAPHKFDSHMPHAVKNTAIPEVQELFSCEEGRHFPLKKTYIIM